MEVFDEEAMDAQEKAWIAEMHRQWLLEREFKELYGDRLNGDPVNDYLVQKGRK